MRKKRNYFVHDFEKIRSGLFGWNENNMLEYEFLLQAIKNYVQLNKL